MRNSQLAGIHLGFRLSQPEVYYFFKFAIIIHTCIYRCQLQWDFFCAMVFLRNIDLHHQEFRFPLYLPQET